MSAAASLQQAIFNVLTAHSGLAALLADAPVLGSPTVKAIYDRAPQAAESEDASAFPYVVIGDDTAIPFDADDFDGQETTITIHAFSRYRGKKQLKQVQDQVYDALHKATLSVSGHDVIYSYFEFSESLMDPDGLTEHGVSRFRVVTVKQ